MHRVDTFPAIANVRFFRKGFNLIEAALVLGIIGGIIGGIWVAASAVTESRKITQMAGDVLSICDRGGRVFPANTPPATTAEVHLQALAANVYPATWIVGSSLVPPIGASGSFYWMDSSQGVLFTGELRLNIDQLTQAQCLRLLPEFANSGSALIRGVQVGTGTWTTSTLYTLPYSGSFTASCDDGPSIHVEIMCRARF